MLVTKYRVKPATLVVPKILEWRKKNLDEHLPRDPYTYYVTDLTRCPLKRSYEINYPEMLYTRIANGRTFIGETTHLGLESILKEIYGDDIVVETEGLEREKELFIEDVGKIKVKGRIDAVLAGKYGVEIKETISTGPLPYPHHAEQAALYNWLYGFEATILLYLTPDGIYEFRVESNLTDDDVKEMIRNPGGIPKYDWECKNCEFRSICSHQKSGNNTQQ